MQSINNNAKQQTENLCADLYGSWDATRIAY